MVDEKTKSTLGGYSVHDGPIHPLGAVCISIALSIHPCSIILVFLGTLTWADGKSQ